MKLWRRPKQSEEERARQSLQYLQAGPGGRGASKRDKDTLFLRGSWTDRADEALDQARTARARTLLYAVLIVLAGLVWWASWAELDEVTRGEARVVPSSQRQLVQAFDGGVVSGILVEEGDIVESGELLMRIDATRYEADVREGRAEYLSLLARAARLEALASGQPLEMLAAVIEEAPSLAERESRLYQSARNELAERRSGVLEQLNQRIEELDEARAQQNQLQRSLDLTREELELTRPLLRSGAVAEVEVLRLERDVANAEGELEQVEAEVRRRQSSVEEAERKISEVELTATVDWQERLGEAESRLSSLEANIDGLEDRVRYTELRAPVRGIVQRLFVTTQGGVVQPGQETMELIPLNDRLLLEVRISPQDIAFLRPGLPAIVRLSAYDFAQYGGVEGTVEQISADTITDDDDNTFYLVRVGLRRDDVEQEVAEATNQNVEIIPGMTATVDILTGKRTVLDYLLKPILRARDIALRER